MQNLDIDMLYAHCLNCEKFIEVWLADQHSVQCLGGGRGSYSFHNLQKLKM
jgi:hypothetical protein